MTDQEQLIRIIEGAILAAEHPLGIDRLVQLFETDPPSRAEIRQAIVEIQNQCEGRGFELKQVASGYRFQVRQEVTPWVSRLWKEKPTRYTRAFLETLALIAYQQPVTRGDIEDVRGVSVSTNIIRSLLEREWIRVVGHRDVPGRPAIYATTREFLDYFNLRSLDELPPLSEIRDLDRLNQQLELEEEGGGDAEGRTIELESVLVAPQEDGEDADLEAVSSRVEDISENIRAFLEEDVQDDPDGEETDDDGLDPAGTEDVENEAPPGPAEPGPTGDDDADPGAASEPSSDTPAP